MKRSHGNWVEGEKFWDREHEIELLKENIDEGAHILLIAQRRIGKTSLMREVSRQISNNYTCLHVDLEKSFTSADAIAELTVAILHYSEFWREKIKGWFKNIFKTFMGAVETIGNEVLTLKLRAAFTEGNWRDKGDQLFALLAEAEKPVVIFFDEVPILVNRLIKGQEYEITPERRQQTDEFMSWLRENSLRHQGKIRIVISGSIGLGPILNQAGLSATVNNFSPFELDPWDSDTAIGCLKALADSYGVSFQEGSCEKVVELLGCCIPSHVQMFFDHIYTHCKRLKKMECSESDVYKIYRESMLSTKGLSGLLHYEERLKMVLGEEIYLMALDLMTEAAVTGYLSFEAAKGLEKSNLGREKKTNDVLKQIIDVLLHDGYLESGPKGYVFRSNLLRDWWKKHNENFYIPVSKRSI